MNVIVHHPQKEPGIRALRKRVAAVHARAVAGYIQRLPCSKAQKLRLIKEIEQSLRD